MATRRSFLHAAGMTIGLLGTAPAWLSRAAAQGSPRRKTLVSIFQRGAADGLNIVVPFFEQRYYQLRPSIAIAAPRSGGVAPAAPIATTNGIVLSSSILLGSNGNPSIDLDGRFALHPQLQSLKPLWDSGQLAIVHATGSPDTSRSHFDAQDFMESGMASTRTNDGWLNRALPASTSVSPLNAVALGKQLPRSLHGSRPAVAVDDLTKFQMKDHDAGAMFEGMYAAASDGNLKTQGNDTFEATRMIDAVLKQPYQPTGNVQYVGAFGAKLRQLAQLIKANVGVEVAFADMDGWDHHINENGSMQPLLNELGSSLAAFCTDMGSRMADIVLVTMSEFGRTAAESGNQGTDHGHGGMMMVLGGAVNGGKVYGKWPGLQPEQLFEGRDLAVTTDYRDVLGELVRDHMGGKPEAVFPGFSVGAPMGLVSA